VRVAPEAVRVGCVFAIELGTDDFVLWRGLDGVVRSAPRWCPHLDHDLADGYVHGDELVCAGHGWAFDGTGNAYKRNELGRVDPKGTVMTLRVDERDGVIDVEAPE